MSGGPADVEAVHPGVPREDGVDQVAEPPPLRVEGGILLIRTARRRARGSVASPGPPGAIAARRLTIAAGVSAARSRT